MLRHFGNSYVIPRRNFKNFGHKRQPVPLPTTLWHGFLTFTFIGLGLQWDVISKLIFGDEKQIPEALRHPERKIE